MVKSKGQRPTSQEPWALALAVPLPHGSWGPQANGSGVLQRAGTLFQEGQASVCSLQVAGVCHTVKAVCALRAAAQ